MKSRLGPIPFVFVLPVALGVVAVVLAIAVWQQAVVPWVEDRLAGATGRKAKIGGLVPRWRRLVARDVVIFGAPPFDAAPLARIANLEIELGGSLFSPVPARITAAGALVTYLSIGLGPGAVDNLRGVPGSAPRAARATGPGAVLELLDSRFEAFVRLPQLPESQGLALRSEGVSGRRTADGQTSTRWEGVVVDVPGWATVRLPRVDLTGKRGQVRLAARDVALLVPGGGPLLSPFALDVTSDAAGVRVDAVPADTSLQGGGKEPGAGRLTARLHLAGRALPRGQLRVEHVPLPALGPLLAAHGLTVTHGRGDLVIELPAGAADVSAGTITVALQHLDVHHPRLDRAPWRGLSLGARLRGHWDAKERRLQVEDGEINALGLAARLTGALSLGPLVGELQISAPPGGANGCAEVLAAWPAVVRDKLAGLAVAGKVATRARLNFDERKWDELGFSIAFSPLCEVTAEPAVIGRLLPGAPSEIFVARAVQHLGVAAADVVPLRTLPEHVVGAFLTAEDASFRKHDGLDPEMIRRAIAHDLAMGSLSKGASTLTQQLVKNLFLSPERTLGRKLAELVLTWRIEQRLDKDQILELYLNAVELGPGIRGIGRASAAYFGKPAAQLTPLEAAHLAALLPNPVGFARRFRDGRVDDGWMLKLLDLLGRMRRSGLLSQASLSAARGSSLSLRKF